MAKRDTLKRLKEQLDCAICQCTYTNPKVLVCNHAYCKGCIERLVTRNGNSVKCPACRMVTPVPERGVSGLQPAFRVNYMLEIEASLSRRSYCPDHDEELKMYCQTCSKLICLRCTIRDASHYKCDYELLDEQYKGDILASLQPLKGKQAAMEEALKQLERCLDEVSDQHVATKASIQDTTRQLHEALEIRQTKLINQLDKVTTMKQEKLATQICQIKDWHAQFEQCQAGVEEKLKTASNEEIATIKSTVIDEIIRVGSLFEEDSLIPSTTADIAFTTSANAIGECLNYGSLSAPELQPDPTQCTATGLGLQAAVVGGKATVIVNFIGDVSDVHYELVSEISGRQLPLNIDSTGERNVVTYTPAVRGRHQLSIRVNGEHIKGSPFTVRVKSEGFGGLISKIQVGFPRGIAVNRKNEVIVSEYCYEYHRISVFHPSGRKLRSFGTHGSKEGQFKFPKGIGVDDEDNILVADSGNNRIQKFTSDGKFLAAVGTRGSGPLQFKRPHAIVFNTFDKKLYVADKKRRVQILNLDFSFCNEFRIRDSDEISIVCDRFGNAYIPSFMSEKSMLFQDVAIVSQIHVYAAGGTYLRSIKIPNFKSCRLGVAIDSTNRLCLCGEQGIAVFSSEGIVLSSFASNRSAFGNTYGIAVDDCDVLYICSDNFIWIY